MKKNGSPVRNQYIKGKYAIVCFNECDETGISIQLDEEIEVTVDFSGTFEVLWRIINFQRRSKSAVQIDAASFNVLLPSF